MEVATSMVERVILFIQDEENNMRSFKRWTSAAVQCPLRYDHWLTNTSLHRPHSFPTVAIKELGQSLTDFLTVSLYLSVYLYLCLCLSVSFSLSLSLSICLSICISATVDLCLSQSLSISLYRPNVGSDVTVVPYLSLSRSLSLFLSICLSLSLCLS